MTLYMDIFIFNVYRTIRTTTKTYKQPLLDFKNKPSLTKLDGDDAWLDKGYGCILSERKLENFHSVT